MTGPIPVQPRRERDPSAIGDWRIEGRIGAGGMGLVYLARRPDGTVGALKVIADHLLDQPGFRKRFAREVAVLRRVEGPGLARVLDADADAEHPYVVTEYIPAPTLQQRVDAAGPVAAPMWNDLARGLIAALAAIHAKGVLHRDIKPSNVLLAEWGPVLIDFGVAAVADTTTAITAPQMLIGTPEWLAPERLSGAPASAASDMFSLGGLLAYAGTGRAPFAASSPAESMQRVSAGGADLAGLTSEQARMVAAMLAPDPARRPSPQHALAMLETAAGPPDATTNIHAAGHAADATTRILPPPEATRVLPPDSAIPKRRWLRPAAITAGAAIAIGLLLAGLFAMLSDGGAGEQAVSPSPSPEASGEFTSTCIWAERGRPAQETLQRVVYSALCDGADIEAAAVVQATSAFTSGYVLSGTIGDRPLNLSSGDGLNWTGTLGTAAARLNVEVDDDLARSVVAGSSIGNGSVRCSGPEPTVAGLGLAWDNPSTVAGTFAGDARVTIGDVAALCNLVVVGVPASGLPDLRR